MIDDFSEKFENFKKNVIEQNKIESKNSFDSSSTRQENKSKSKKKMNIFALAKASKSEGKIKKKIPNRVDSINKHKKRNINDYITKKFDQIRFKRRAELTEFQKTINIVKLKDRELLLREYSSLAQTDSNSNLNFKNSFYSGLKLPKKILKIKKQNKLKFLFDKTYNYYNCNFYNKSSHMKNKKDVCSQISPESILSLNIKQIIKGKKTLLELKNYNKNFKHCPTLIMKNNINNYSRNYKEYSCSNVKKNINLDLCIINKRLPTTKTTRRHRNLYKKDLTYNNVFPRITFTNQEIMC